MTHSSKDTSVFGFILGVIIRLVIVIIIYSIQRHYLHVTLVSKSSVTTGGILAGFLITGFIMLRTKKKFGTALSKNVYLYFWTCIYGIGLSAVLLFVNYQFRQESFTRVRVPINVAWPKDSDSYWFTTVYEGTRRTLPLEAKFPDPSFVPSTAHLTVNKGFFGFDVISEIEVERKLPTTSAF